MIDIDARWLIGAIVIALIFLAGTWWATAAISALMRVTRKEMVESVQSARRQQRVEEILDRRQPTSVVLSLIRFLFTCLCGAMLAFLCLSLESVSLAATVFAGILVLILLLIFLISPTRFGYNHATQIVNMSSGMLKVASILSPLFSFNRHLSADESEQAAEEQRALMVERVSESEAFDENERELLESLIDIRSTIVREVMVPRTDMITIRFDQSLDKAISLFSRSGYSRVPVTGESTDDLRGTVYLKDAIKRTHHRLDSENAKVEDVMRTPLFVPETVLVDNLLRTMQSTQVHMAIVVDEYGGIAGLVTIEDIVEELVGEISDEHDKAEESVEEIAPGRYRIPARLPISELGELFDIELHDDDVDTAGGLLAKLLGRVPLAGAHAQIEGIELEAERFGGRRRRLHTLVAYRSHVVDEENENGK